MLKKLLLAGAATALIAAPASAHDSRWERHRYNRDNSGEVLVGALLGAAVGAAIASADNHHGYGYPAHGFRYPRRGYSYPAYGYRHAYPRYVYAYPSYGVGINVGDYRPHRGHRYRGW